MKWLVKSLVSFLLFILVAASLVFLFDLFVSKSSLIGRYLPSAQQVKSTESKKSNHSVTEEPHALVLSEQALRNIGVTSRTIGEVTVSSYDKTISFPAILADRPGRSAVRIPSPFGGIVQKVYIEPGMVVVPGQPLFDIVLTHEELVSCQGELITLCQKQDILSRELRRLETLSDDIAPKAKREIEFQKAEIDSQIETQRTLLRIHGISDEEIRNTIEKKREILRFITIKVPQIGEDAIAEMKPNGSNSGIIQASSLLAEVASANPVVPIPGGEWKASTIQLDQLFVDRGQLVNVGDMLCQLVDLSMLYIEGRAFADDEKLLATALLEHCNVAAVFEQERVESLRIRFIDTRIDSASRTLRFFVELPNSQIKESAATTSHQHAWKKDEKGSSCDCDMHRPYINWKYRPGQRCELQIEYDTIPNCIVLPREAVAESGNDAFVFEWTGNEPGELKRKVWMKKPVHVVHRDKHRCVIANDGSVFPGAKIATIGAGQLLVALTSGSGQLQSACPCGDH